MGKFFTIVCLCMLLLARNGGSLQLPEVEVDKIVKNVMKTVIRFSYGKDFDCEECKKVENEVKELLTAFFVTWKPIIGDICKALAERSTLTEEGCNTIVGRYVPIFQHSFNRLMIFHHGLICTFMLEKCDDGTITRVDLKPVFDQIYKDMPQPVQRTPTLRKSYSILQVNDIHIDFEYMPGGIVNCKEGIMCCRANKTAIEGQDPVYAGAWGSLGGNCDLPQATFLQFVQTVKKIKPDYIFWLGDNENHEVDMITKDVNVNTTKYIVDTIAKELPDTKIFLSIGNHENFPADSMDFDDPRSNKWFFEQLVGDYKPLLTPDEQNQILKTGYYSTYVSAHNLRIVSLYSAPFDSLNIYLLVRTYDPDGQLAWLWDTLKKAEANNEDVFIILHIPIGNDFSIAQWDQVFNALIERYQNTVRGIFSAHTHNDHLIFHRQRDNNQKIIKTQYVAPSLTTFSNLQPSFRVFTVDTDTNELVDYTQYRLDLDKWNQAGPEATPEWDVAYTFKNYYGAADLSAKSMQTIYDSFQADYTNMGPYIKNFYTGTYKFDEVSAEQAVKLKCIMYADSSEVIRCMGILTPFIASDEFMTLILGNIFPAFMQLH